MTTAPNNQSNAARRDPSLWMALDAGDLREVLAEEMARWLASGFFSIHRIKRLHRYVHRLAALAELSDDEVYRTLRGDAVAILEDRGQQPHHIFRP